MAGLPITYYHAEPADQRVIEPLDSMTLIYQRQSGITHIVAEPVPQILAAMGYDAVDVATLVARLVQHFDLGDADEAHNIIGARLEELADLGLVDRVHINAA